MNQKGHNSLSNVLKTNSVHPNERAGKELSEFFFFFSFAYIKKERSPPEQHNGILLKSMT